jgi:hypothetical protein
MATPEPTAYYNSTCPTDSYGTYYYITDESYSAVDFVITTTHSDINYIHFEPKELVDWRGLEKCFTGFKSNYKLNSSSRYNIRQPAKDHRNKRRMRIQQLNRSL